MSDNDPLVYDVGMNNGDDCEYYLTKGYRVVGIEANPILCAEVTARFESEITSGRLHIVNVGVGPETGRLPFYVHKYKSVLSTFVPFGERIGFTGALHEGEFEAINVEIKRLSDVVRYFGPPEYIKIDVEGFDAICLRDLDRHQIYPRYLSAEAHSFETLCNLIVMGYQEFKVVAGASIGEQFANLAIRQLNGDTFNYHFKHHAAGPFGEDIPGNWVTRDAIIEQWCRHGGGWFDLHARRSA